MLSFLMLSLMAFVVTLMIPHRHLAIYLLFAFGMMSACFIIIPSATADALQGFYNNLCLLFTASGIAVAALLRYYRIFPGLTLYLPPK